MTKGIRLRRVFGRYGIARLAPDAPIPNWINGPELSAVIRADDELTIVCAADRIPEGVETDSPWACFRSVGPFDFQTTGIVQSLVAPLSEAGIGVFVLCTYDGEHILVAEQDCERAFNLLAEAGHTFVSSR